MHDNLRSHSFSYENSVTSPLSSSPFGSTSLLSTHVKHTCCPSILAQMQHPMNLIPMADVAGSGLLNKSKLEARSVHNHS